MSLAPGVYAPLQKIGPATESHVRAWTMVRGGPVNCTSHHYTIVSHPRPEATDRNRARQDRTEKMGMAIEELRAAIWWEPEMTETIELHIDWKS